MPRKKIPTTVTTKQKKQRTIIHKDLKRLLSKFRELNIPDGEEGLNINDTAAIILLREIDLIARLSQMDMIPKTKSVKFLNEAYEILFQNHKYWRDIQFSILFKDLGDLFKKR